jgi:hypothetical protein
MALLLLVARTLLRLTLLSPILVLLPRLVFRLPLPVFLVSLLTFCKRLFLRTDDENFFHFLGLYESIIL